MQAIKENRVYTITEADVESFRAEGYDVYDDKGNVVAYGKGKTVAFDTYVKVVEENKKLTAEVASLKKQLTEAEGKPTKKDSKK